MIMLTIKVVPQSGKSEIILDKQGRLKAFLKAAPEKGKANKELIKLLAKALGCPQALITLIAGASHRHKTLKLALPLSYEEVVTKLGLSLQTSLLS